MSANQFTFVLDQLGKERALYQLSRATIDGSWEVVFQPHKNGRSLAQNRLLWLWNRQIADFLTEHSDGSFSADDVHEWLCEQFLPKRVIEIDGQPKIGQVGTSQLKVDQFSEYLEKVSHWAADRETPIPLKHPADMFNEAMGRV